MKGSIFKGIQDLVESKFGRAAWQKVAAEAGCVEPFFIAGEDYPDETAVLLIAAAARATSMTEDEVMIEFGKYWVLNTAKSAYPTLLHIAGDCARSFLLNMNRVHDLVTRNLLGAHPPRFEYDTTEDGALLIHYSSKRMLCPILRGLIIGVGMHFQEDLKVDEITCMRTAGDRCTMKVVFP
jgi:hypothetical protein